MKEQLRTRMKERLRNHKMEQPCRIHPNSRHHKVQLLNRMMVLRIRSHQHSQLLRNHKMALQHIRRHHIVC